MSEYVQRMVEHLLKYDEENEYVLFFSHHRAKITDFELRIKETAKAHYSVKKFLLPIILLEFLWNRLHIIPIEWLIGNIDVFYTSDWVEPPSSKARKITTIHDLSILKVPETFDKNIVAVHKRKLRWVMKESDAILCDSEATKGDVHELLKIGKDRLYVVYPGVQ